METKTVTRSESWPVSARKVGPPNGAATAGARVPDGEADWRLALVALVVVLLVVLELLFTVLSITGVRVAPAPLLIDDVFIGEAGPLVDDEETEVVGPARGHVVYAR